jgi:hypothetical protein
VNAWKRKTYQISGFARTVVKLEAKAMGSKLAYENCYFFINL